MFGGEEGMEYDVNYHQAGDNFTNLNFEASRFLLPVTLISGLLTWSVMQAFVTNTQAIAAAVAEYATSWDLLPRRNATAAVKAKRSAEVVKARQHRRGACSKAMA